MSIKQIMILGSTFLIFVAAFQNCGQTNPDVLFSQNSKILPSEVSDNGHPYDGKIYVLTGDVCPDGTRLRSRIEVKSSVSASLVRNECQEITPIALGPKDFQINPNNPAELLYQSQIFVNQLVGTKLEMSLLIPDGGFCYWMTYDFGTLDDNDTFLTRSQLQVYEDGKPLGPAHAVHQDIRNTGLGLFSHWKGTLRFSASDNSNPLTNGRTYTWDVK